MLRTALPPTPTAHRTGTSTLAEDRGAAPQLLLWARPGAARCQPDHPRAPDHRPHRPLRLRQVHLPAHPQPHERRHRGSAGRRARCCSTARTCSPRRWTWCRCGGGWAWCSSAPTPSPCPSSTTSPTGRASTASRAGQRPGGPGGEQPAARGAVGGGEGQAARLRLRPLRRAAAAAVHRPRAGGGAGGAAHGRAGLRPRPHLHAAHRGVDARAASRTTPSSSSPTTCSRPPASPTRRGSS